MVKKKPFINKKTAQHFHVVHRSQRDPKANDPNASKFVLLAANRPVELASDSEYDDEDEDDDEVDDESDDEMPDLVDSPRASTTEPSEPAAAVKKPSKRSSKTAFPTRKVRFGGIEAEDLVDELGMVRDGYDYSQHLKEMGKGRFYSASGEFASHNELARRVALPEDVLPSAEEQDRLLEAITLTTETMDDDLREALNHDEYFEELNDDFVLQAAQEDPEADGADGFDYDAHIAKLMAAASGVPKFKGDLTDDEDDEELSDLEDDELGEEDEMDDADKTEHQRTLDEAFEKLMAEEYDDDQLGELEEDDPETRGDVVLQGELLDTIVEDYANLRQEMLNDEGKLGNPFRTGNRLKEILEECERERLAEEDAEEENDVAVSPEQDEDVEQQLTEMFMRSAYLAPREREQWDVETIVSTYSNLDNHPTILRDDDLLKKKRNKKKKSDALSTLSEDDLAAACRDKSKIVLSRKTGMPIGIFEFQKEEAAAAAAAAAKQQKGAPAVAAQAPKKKREESKEEKKARKEAVKLQKQQRRQEKKQWKTAFKDEEQRQIAQTQPGKVSIFKHMHVEIELPGQCDELTFVLGDRKLQHIELRRRCPLASSVQLLFKVQSTSSRRFRVRPTLGILSSSGEEVTTIQIQLAPGELKELWKRAESKDYESLVFSKTIPARIIEAPLHGNAMENVPVEKTKHTSQPATKKSEIVGPELTRAVETTQQGDPPAIRAVPEQLPIDSVEQRAHVRLKDKDPRQWQVLDEMAQRLRQLLRAHRHQARA
ncbi:hypothetical protein P43SY_009988 [Pythium insidiosum]|uniref:Uncharacterized protein n=1 Tax=Pythium insidiosum TaxID=114742 RepID=A0AAD5LGW7_PYTIN|nr:hypothetical protein P43SY_009988 [Pythium insidiosum]